MFPKTNHQKNKEIVALSSRFARLIAKMFVIKK